MRKGKKGKVYLVGAGPGDPGLLTLKAKACLEKADVVIYDHLANEVFLDHADEKAAFIYVGKKGGDHTLSQDEINKLIVDKAQQGHMIVRLKGGDPFIFGRGGEEAEELVKAGVPFEIVPGITSAIAVPAYAGIPLTHRDYTSTVAFITGHEDPTKETSSIAWDKLSTGVGTIVFLMGITKIASICNELIKNGRSPNTPVAVIHKGTHPEQVTVEGNLENIAEIVKSANIRPPGIIVVGDVVGLRKGLNWFEDKPLLGKKIIVTRAREQASDFLTKLLELGVHCVEFPTIEIVPPDNWEPLDKAIEDLPNYDWLLFTSVNSVKYFFKRVYENGKDTRCLKNIKVGAVGPKTAEAVRENGVIPDLIPEEYKAESVADSFRNFNTENIKVLLPKASKARKTLPDELKKMGADIDEVTVYHTIMPEGKTDEVKSMLEAGDIDMVTFTSSSTVTNFINIFGPDSEKIKSYLKDVDIASIGPITSDTAKKNGLKITVEAKDYTIDGLIEAILEYYG